jgi:hypothetical protein
MFQAALAGRSIFRTLFAAIALAFVFTLFACQPSTPRGRCVLPPALVHWVLGVFRQFLALAHEFPIFLMVHVSLPIPLGMQRGLKRFRKKLRD